MSAIKRLLVANRGEIACRVIRACKRLGIESVAVFSDADRHSQHVQQADMAVHIGGSAANESYLNAEAIIAAANKISADAIHPGYGFLSESTALISLCQQQGIIFVGPSVESIAAMGSKIEAKAIAQSLDIPTVPGYNGDAQDLDTLLDQGLSIGFPLLIKASAGGGGKGMRIVHAEGEFENALKQARQEALSAFGDDRVLLEKYIVRPRHIEVQLLGDSHGHVLHLLDRECSIQRNYQKVIEEAPVSHLDDNVRQELFDCAVRLGKHLNYQGAGTVEFILDADSRAAYFLEMNTRLQVEHPTTEMVTGLDLVEWQIRIARGEPLVLTQADIHANGHAIEARVNAEDPANDYLPEIGTITLYREPVAEGVRIDSGVAQGAEITLFYDSMVAKIIAHGGSRGLAAQRLLQGLNNFAIGGVKTNQEFLTSIITRPAFHQELTTQYLSQQFPNGWQPWGESMHAAIAAAACALQQESVRSHSPLNAPLNGTPWQSKGAWRLTQLSGTPATSRFWLQSAAGLQEIKIQGRQGRYNVSLLEGNDEQAEWVSFPIQLYQPQQPSQKNAGHNSGQWRVELEGTHRNLDIVIRDQHVSLSSPRLRRSYQFVGLEESQLGAAAGSKNAGNEVRAAMPGLVTDVLVQEGDLVTVGDTAAVMEAMKLIHNLPCPVSGVVKEVRVAAGDKVEDGALLISIEPAAEE